MNGETITLLVSVIAVSCLHTASGPDHYLPFIVLSRSKGWPVSKTIAWTILCGLGHVLSSLLIGLVGLWLGWQLSSLSWLQDIRGNISAWALFIFGILYLGWGILQAWRDRPHQHFDLYGSDLYVYRHRHHEAVPIQKRVRVTPWILFAIFVMGPSEPLLPILFYSGSTHSVAETGLIILIFSLTTVLTMTGMVLLGLYGYSFFRTDTIGRYLHAIGGAVITLCGLGMLAFSW